MVNTALTILLLPLAAALTIALVVVAVAPVFGQNVVSGDAKRGVAILHQCGNIGGALKYDFYAGHTVHMRQVLTRIAAIDFQAAFGQEGQCGGF